MLRHHVLILWACFLMGGWTLASCAPAAPPSIETQEVEKPIPAPTPTLVIIHEARVIEIEWPARIHLGDSDVVRLQLSPIRDGYQITSEFPDHQVESQDVDIRRIEGYELLASARLDGAGFSISPQGEYEQVLEFGDPISWRWSVRPEAPGKQRLVINVTLHWVSKPGTSGLDKKVTLYSRGLNVQVASFAGLTRQQSQVTGFGGLVIGLGLFLSVFMAGKKRVPGVRVVRQVANPDLVLELQPGVRLSKQEGDLLRSVFRLYARVVVVSEFLSGYSGARTFLVRPLHEDGRSDAFTIVKMGQENSIQREVDNYQVFVKDRLPPVTARIQQLPVTLSRKRNVSPPRYYQDDDLAAVQYTFIGVPGFLPVSLRQALLSNSDSQLITKLFDTFGLNWWMQKKPYTFRVAVEYDRLLPSHLVVEPSVGRGKLLDGAQPPTEMDVKTGDVLTLRNFPLVEKRLDGKSVTLNGNASPGWAGLRVRWLSLDYRNGVTGRVVATRSSILREQCQNFELYGLPEPLEAIEYSLDRYISGTQSVIHGDLNLENVLVGPGELLWLIDFALTREGHTLFDFAHLGAELIAHIIAHRIASAEEFLACFEQAIFSAESINQGSASQMVDLLTSLQKIVSFCLFNPSDPREFYMVFYLACLGALKHTNLTVHARHLLYLSAARLCKELG